MARLDPICVWVGMSRVLAEYGANISSAIGFARDRSLRHYS